MSTLRIVVLGLLFLLTLVFGIWLSQAGKPYNTTLFNIHKLIALGAVIVTGMTVYQLHSELDFKIVLMSVVTGLLFLGLFVSGALLSIGKPEHSAILIVHRVASLLAVIATILTLYLLVSSKA